ncbi:MAG: adenylate/guanylate cyclase domain-containing protein, partial [Candidatus Riflebacteria bacterium]|nr:adenylate/guanylate cyclase domain-containing protein [Candidatus Riflebacteria bacterium]
NWQELTPSFEQKIAVGGFNAALGNTAGGLTEEFDRRKGIIVTRKNGNKLISYIYDYIIVEDVPRFAIFIYWDMSSLDELTIQSTIDYLSLQEPNQTFSAIKVTPQGNKEWFTSRHWANFKIKADDDIINQAFLNKSSVTFTDDNKTIIAVPSKKYSDTIIIGAISHHNMIMPIFNRFLICIVIIAISIMIFIVCLYISFKLFLNPIDKVKKALDRIALGEFDLEIKSSRKDEFGTICKEFTNMAHELSERNKLATLISDHAIEALSRKEESDDLANVESFIGATLVSDIRNFTGMCEHYPPDQITTLLNEHFAVMTKIISQNGGRIYKYIGDAIEVVFANQDDSKKTSVERAFQASIEMIEGLREINKKRLANGLFEYKIGIGLGYGEMLSGSIGSLETRLDYAIIGKALENAAKTESLSKFNPNLPIVFAKEFVEELKKQYSKIDFTTLKNDSDINNYIIANNNLETYFEEKGKNTTINTEISEVLDIANKTDKATEKTNKIIETEKKFSNAFYFSNAFVFLILFTLVVFGGIYFSYSSTITNKKVALSYDNQRVFEQLSSEDYGKVAFDIKGREIAKKLNDKINEIKDQDVPNELIDNVLNECFKPDKVLKNSGFNKLFVRVKNYKESININNKEFYNNISLEPISNTGYTIQEQKDLCNTYRICITINALDEITENSNTNTNKENSFQLSVKRNMERDYGEPSRQVFGENALISLLISDWLNTSVEVTYNGENHYLYTLDFYKLNKKNPDIKPELIGFLIISLSKAQALNSIPLILNAYSQDGGLIAVKKTNEKSENKWSWSFSDNISDEIRNNIINKNIIQDHIENEADKNIVDNYFKSLSDIIAKDNLNIGDGNYDIYVLRPYKSVDKITLSFFIGICILIIFIYYYFIRI